MTDQVAYRINVNGVVQAVGFRPFVYRIATDNDLIGWVKNLGDAGVEIFLQGDRSDIDRFIEDLREKNPPLAEIDNLDKAEVETDPSLEEFDIVKSSSGSSGSGTIPPDIATCEDCLDDVFGDTRFSGYWATSCVNCGPRFSVIKELPYDRNRTSMEDFPLCEGCQAEYTDPGDRRYHAQTIACPDCGPNLWLENPNTGEKFSDNPIQKTVQRLKDRKILAIKGLGGTHIACNARDDGTVSRLRDELGRLRQPFALMAKEDAISSSLEYNEKELKQLKGPRRPIVLLEKKDEQWVSEGVAPGLHNIGVMLPYTALHHLIFSDLDFPLVMTSANMPGDPMLTENDSIREELAEIVDGYLLHDREIVSRVDDSVVRFSGGYRKFIRRSRGWVPEPLDVELGRKPILAMGAEQDNVIGLYTDGKAYLSQYLGDTEGPEDLEFLEDALDRLLALTSTEMPHKVAHDLHPGFLTSKRAEEVGKETCSVQHHKAHIGSLLAEGQASEIVGVIMDGVGYGENDNIWGCEVITGKGKELNRLGSLTRAYMPGGDLATRHPARMVAGILYPLVERGTIDDLPELIRSLGLKFPDGDQELRFTLQQLERDINAPLTTSAGRFLDAVSSLLGVCDERTYEGEPAMKLESFAKRGDPVKIETSFVEKKGVRRFDQSELFYNLIQLKGELPAEDVAATAQRALASGVAELAIEIAENEGIETIGFSGGVAYNESISRTIEDRVKKAGLKFTTNEAVPPGDGGIALGQLWLAGKNPSS
ncbi:MAG: carbamoyltransferase HypF [Candidatus Acetothermia bacterium]